MDNFIDKLAQKFTSGEVIRANQAAEEREMRRLREQVAEYERCLQEMRKLQLRNTQTGEELKQLLDKTKEEVDKLTEAALSRIEKLAAPCREEGLQEELEQIRKTLEESAEKMAEQFRQADDFLHKENVKVYRNVQAVVVDEVKAAREALSRSQETVAGKYYKRLLWIVILSFLASAAAVTLQVLSLCGVL